MPELPEVEVVRRGLSRRLTGTALDAVEVVDPRILRRHVAGPEDFRARTAGAVVTDVVRRGKYLWLELDSGEALLTHLGMSGQLLLQPPDVPDERHLRLRVALGGDPGCELRFVDQRIFGSMAVTAMVPAPDGRPGGTGSTGRPPAALLPAPVAHIARDPLDPHLDEGLLLRRLLVRRSGVKRALLDQALVSGIGNIYADEALWRAGVHYDRSAAGLTRPGALRLLEAVRTVMGEALAEGGTSFDSLYVNVNGESGYFDRALAVYGRAGLPCRRCGTAVRRDPFMNRSSFTCPRCQPRPRPGSGRGPRRAVRANRASSG
ncbi:MAG: bifunctional DNA-formamidopyrimidine glycosylase/DNA-(apurinic or apyrimidinic site) lyase [Actinomycetales bacterium]|nr:bifunctional DNA-formamidopyrimidine glycosylase/DNA-(apurinic or apyrimidinic site) lyase [Actinomycetales bacterium]